MITGIHSSLTILNVSDNDLGSYSCVAINKGGMAESNASLIVEDSSVVFQTAQEVFIIILITGISAVIAIGLLIYNICISRSLN